jgi:hypothetical protein
MAGQDRQDSSQGLIALTLSLNPAPAGFFVSGRGAKNAALKKENHHKQGFSPPATQITLSAKGLIFFFASTIVLIILKFTEKIRMISTSPARLNTVCSVQPVVVRVVVVGVVMNAPPRIG